MEQSRRGFLHRWAATTSLAASTLFLSNPLTAQAKSTKKKPKPKPKPKDFELPQLYTGQNGRLFREIQSDEAAHVQALITEIQTLGGTPRPEPTFQNLTQATLQSFLTSSVVFENTGVGAYQGAAQYILSPTVSSGAVTIALVEALHSGYLNALLNLPLVPGAIPFSTALSQAEVVSRVTPYIASLNGGAAPQFSTTPSAQNDIDILNFALLLEYLERDFYNINVPKFFP